MARQVRRISELPEATELTGDELPEIVQDGENHRVTVDQLSGGGAVQSVQGRTGDVVITADDVGLGSADNTSDTDKPVSTAQQAALDGKVDSADARLSDSREWSAATVTQAEAETGTATTRRAWTAQRVRQAIVAWWDSTASASGKTVATGTPAQGRTALGLGTGATANVTGDDLDVTTGRLLKVGDYGLGVSFLTGALDCNTLVRHGFYYSNDSSTNKPTPLGGMLYVSGGGGAVILKSQLFVTRDGSGVYQRVLNASGAFLPWRKLWDSGNTTVDSNGFIKNASPIIKMHSDRVETEADGAFERLGAGHYQLTGCNGLRLDDGWYIETPHDRNKNPYFNAEWYQDVEPATDKGVLEEAADVALSIHCYERVWNPSTGTWDNGEPVDIPEGRWIDLRMNEVRQPEPEMPEMDDNTEAAL